MNNKQSESSNKIDKTQRLETERDKLKHIKAKRETDAFKRKYFEYYDDYTFSVDYDDVKNFYDEEASEALVENPGTHGETEGTSVLMIQNQKITNSTVYGTAQYYTSGSTVTLSAGTAAEVSVWVKTSNLTHYEDQPADGRCGAYIGVINTVGGTTLDQMQIKNINTETLNPDGENNGWVQYTLYVRASTFASSTVTVVSGLTYLSLNFAPAKGASPLASS